MYIKGCFSCQQDRNTLRSTLHTQIPNFYQFTRLQSNQEPTYPAASYSFSKKSWFSGKWRPSHRKWLGTLSPQKWLPSWSMIDGKKQIHRSPKRNNHIFPEKIGSAKQNQSFPFWEAQSVHPGRLTWKLKMMVWFRWFSGFQGWVIFEVPAVHLPGCKQIQVFWWQNFPS